MAGRQNYLRERARKHQYWPGCESEQQTAIMLFSKVLGGKLGIKSRSIPAYTLFLWAGDEELGEHCKERERTQRADRDEMRI